jgi:hypothetical protein
MNELDWLDYGEIEDEDTYWECMEIIDRLDDMSMVRDLTPDESAALEHLSDLVEAYAERRFAD